MLRKVYNSAVPQLKGKKVRDLCIGIELLAVELDGGEIGVAYVLKNEIGCGCELLPEPGALSGMDAEELSSQMLQNEGGNPLSNAVGVAVCNAVTDYDALSSEVLDAADVFAVRPGDTVGMIGNIGPVAKQLKPKAKRMIVFDRGKPEGVYPEERKLAAEYEDLEQELYLTEEFIRTKVRLLEDKINSKFRMARFKLFEVQVNGALAETAETMYNGVPYSNLNNGARINVGLDIIRTLAKHYNFYPPIFIDNRESITELIDVSPQQTISLIVSEKDQELRAELKEEVKEAIA
jgi:hypothetical protein